MAGHIVKPQTYYLIFAALIVLTLATTWLHDVDLGVLHTPTALVIATAKALMVVLVFMHVWYSPRLTWVVALSSLLWLGILMTYTLTDYLTRPMFPVAGGSP